MPNITYEAAVKIAEQLRKFDKNFTHLIVIFEDKNRKQFHDYQNTFFFDKSGDLIVNGKKK